MRTWWLIFFLVAGVRAGAEEAGPGGRLRRYFIAAENVRWNFAPRGNVLAGSMPGDQVDADVWLQRGTDGLPPVFLKAVFQEYTDATFTRRQARPPEWQHLGILGPLLRAEVGDRFEITLRNNVLFPVSLHPHGVFYPPDSEGAHYPAAVRPEGSRGDAVAPGQQYTYHWDVPERAGPGPNDPSSLVWLYHSHVDSMRDASTGLVGTIIVTRRGAARPDGAPRDVDREFVTLFYIFNETLSHYSVSNTRLFAAGTGAAALADKDEKMAPMVMIPGASMFAASPEANQFAINGFILGNLPRPVMKVGERVRWYLVGLGNETDVHTPHWHGNVVLSDGHRTDAIALLPASMKVADMVPDSPGVWMYHCHVEDHMMAGMTALYEVQK